MENKFFESEVDRKERYLAIKKEFFIVIAALTVGMVLFFIWYKTTGKKVMKVYADMEQTYEIRGRMYLSEYGFFPADGLTIVPEAFNGKASIRISPEQKYSLNFEHWKLTGGESVGISAWRKIEKPGRGSPEFVISTGDFWRSAKKPSRVNPVGWEKVGLNVVLPAGVGEKGLKIYWWNPGGATFLIDDLEIIIRN